MATIRRGSTATGKLVWSPPQPITPVSFNPVPPPVILPPKATIKDWTPKSGIVPFTVTAVWEKEAGSGPITTVQWLLNGQIVAPNNSPSDPDHHYKITNPGTYRIDLRVIGPGGTSQTGKIRLIQADSPHPTPPIPPIPPPEPPTPGPGQVLVRVVDVQMGTPIPNASTWFQHTPQQVVLTNANGYALVTADPSSGVCAEKAGYHGPGAPNIPEMCKVWAPTIELGLEPFPPPARRGLVRSEGHTLADDDGQFFALGGTAFWYLGGYTTDRPRVIQHWDWWKSHGADYLRYLCHASGSGDDAYAPGFPAALRGLVQDSYAHGLRAFITIFGQFNGTSVQRQQVVDTVRDVCLEHPERVLGVEIANEATSIHFPIDEAKKYAKQLLAALPHQISVSAPAGDDCPAQTAMYSGLSPISRVMVTLHYSRKTSGDGGVWDPMTQPWRGGHQWCLGGGERIDDNEPIGPCSSVQQNTDPRQLATMVGVDFIGGGGCHVVHVGSGVSGIASGPTPTRPWPRPANVWEEVNIDAILHAITATRRLFPPDCPNWQRGGSTDGPWSASLGTNGAIDRLYSSWNGAEARSVAVHVKKVATLTARRKLVATVYDTLDGLVILDRPVEQGQTITLQPDRPGVVIKSVFL